MNKTIKQLAEAYAAACKEEAQDLLRALGKIPAPTHREDLRAAFCRDWFLRQGAEDVSIDWAKNVICKLGTAIWWCSPPTPTSSFRTRSPCP